jgi:prevent-host-death family protein
MNPVRSIAASEFKAKCLEILDRVAREGSACVVTKRGRPVAKVVPIEEAKPRSLRRSVTYLADIVGPVGDAWPVDDDGPATTKGKGGRKRA